MCARFTLAASAAALRELLDLREAPDLPPRYNVAPSHAVPVVGLKADGVSRALRVMAWGLVPRWSKSPNDGPRPVNARAETVATAAPFRDSFRLRRCLIPADGFYEWRGAKGAKRATHFSLADGGPFAFAGLWDAWDGGSERLKTCCLLTTTPNELVKVVHDRMPVILPRERYGEWLDPATPPRRLAELLVPFPAVAMRGRAVGPRVNSSRVEGPECLDAAGRNGPSCDRDATAGGSELDFRRGGSEGLPSGR